MLHLDQKEDVTSQVDPHVAQATPSPQCPASLQSSHKPPCSLSSRFPSTTKPHKATTKDTGRTQGGKEEDKKKDGGRRRSTRGGVKSEPHGGKQKGVNFAILWTRLFFHLPHHNETDLHECVFKKASKCWQLRFFHSIHFCQLF